MFEYFSTSNFTSKICPQISYKLKKMSKGRRTAFNLSVASLIVKKTELQQKLVPISEEITRAEEQAKLEPCSCSHPKTEEVVAERKKQLEEINKQLPVPVEIVDVCHSSTTKRCLVEGCNCRKPRPDPAIGGYVQYQQIMEQIIDIDANEIGIARVKFFVSEVQGLKIDGKEATIDLLIEEGNDALVDELSAEVSRLLSLSPEDALGFKQPTTGGAVVESQGPTTDQPTADPADKASSTSSAAADSTSQI